MGSTRCSRRGLAFVRATLALWWTGADSTAGDDALLVAAELLSNAAHHAGGPLVLDLRLDRNRQTLRIAVTDAVPDPPRMRNPEAGQPHGRGLRIVDRLATAWGTTPAGAGKTVWAELRLPPADTLSPPDGARPSQG
ncbi:ATP-binding protein [Kitasatospora sp. A2-31]|uniref:ATP-binding protein n=1 Tax=Kitasatospora sp. A2-31 TaxID=2916414 RepID=UPI001EEBFBA8|nr:ATP-binding protein [Kitasatospora sp. A2-31]MCG6494387.1 ATP-binding protein [Kitasatospora sp. A2-31]